jgi:hypothetical protein
MQVIFETSSPPKQQLSSKYTSRGKVACSGEKELKSKSTSSILPSLSLGLPKKTAQDAQVAQAVERSPEKAGVGGSTPSLGTI